MAKSACLSSTHGMPAMRAKSGTHPKQPPSRSLSPSRTSAGCRHYSKLRAVFLKMTWLFQALYFTCTALTTNVRLCLAPCNNARRARCNVSLCLLHDIGTLATMLQAMILVEDPYYNEPAHEAARGTDTGRSSAASYNAELTLNVSVWVDCLLGGERVAGASRSTELILAMPATIKSYPAREPVARVSVAGRVSQQKAALDSFPST
eukprot:scaffold190831_cov17-Tisochrysis_lutea.AAC.1